MKREVTNYHVGFEIRKEAGKQKMSARVLADKLHCCPNNVYYMYRNPRIDIERLAEVSKILKRNFLMEYAVRLEL